MPQITRRHGAIALTSASVLLLQIALTRVLSVLLWYHWAFFAISLAMLGMGAPGVWLALREKRPKVEHALLFGGCLAPLGVSAIIHGSHRFGPMAILFCMGALLPALLALGTAICLLLLEAEGPAVSVMYGSDLFGACCGALAVVPLLARFPTPQLCAASGLLPLLAHELCAPPEKRWLGRAAAAVTALSLFAGAAYRIEFTKQYRETGVMRPIFVRWTPTARLAVFPSIPWSPEGFRWGLGDKAARAAAPEQYWLEQDASAGTPITRYRGDDRDLGYLLYDVTSVGYQLRRPERVAIVGAGGGRDILTAHLAGASAIDAIELNAGIVAAMRREFRGFSGDVYDLPGVRAIVGEGRSVLTRSAGGYDLIQISMIDSWAATAAGAYALSENNLYTLEAYRLYFERLSPRGLVSTSRWLKLGFGLEVPRLLLLEQAALAKEGVAEPQKHLAVVQAGDVATVLMSRAPLSDGDIAELRRAADERGFLVALPPPDKPKKGVLPFSRLLADGPGSFEKLGLNLAPPTDDKPFFFQIFSPFHLPAGPIAAQLGINAQGVIALRALMIAMAAVTLLLFFSPFLLSRLSPRGRLGQLGRGPDFWQGSGYFLCIGLGFMLLEIGFLSRAVLYLGHPSLAATAALGFMLLGAGTGSMLSRRLAVSAAQRWGFSVAVVTALVNLGQGPLMRATLGLPLPARLCLTGAMLVPAGVAMGFCFPIGMVAFGEEHKAWLWAINGAASVLASVASLALAMEFGYLRVGYLGAVLYLPAWLLLAGRGRPFSARAAVLAAFGAPLALASASHLYALWRTVAERLRYPIDLEWMEGGQLLAALRLLRGQPLYDACKDGFIPFAYPPVHAALVAMAGKLFGLDYPVGRAVSVTAFCAAFYLLAREAYWAAGRGARGLFAGLAALGWLAASYPVAGAWYDLIRVDAVMLLFLVGGAVLSLPRTDRSPRGPLAPSRIAVAAIAITAAVYSKQTAALFVPWLCAFAIWRHRKSGLWLTLAVGSSCGGLLALLQWSSRGVFWTLVFDVMRRHPLIPESLANAIVTIVGFAPFVLLMPAGVGWLYLTRRLSPRLAFWSGMTLCAVLASVFTTAKVGAYINNVMTAVVFVPPTAIMIGAAWLGGMPRRRVRRVIAAGAGALSFGWWLWNRRFDVAELVPGPADYQSAAALLSFIHDLPGGVLVPGHPFIAIREGQRNRQTHEQGYVDVMGAAVDSIDVPTCLAHLDANWLIINNMAEPHLTQLFGVAFEPAGDLPAAARMLIGKYTVPTKLYRRRPGDPWAVHRTRVRPLFDFESGDLAGWQRQGRAFDPGVTPALLDYQQPIAGQRGHFLVNSYHPVLLDEARGAIRSPAFTIDRARLGFRMGGGRSRRLRVELWVDGQRVREAAGVGSGSIEVLFPVIWDVRDWQGKRAQIAIVDDDAGPWGHVLADAFELFD